MITLLERYKLQLRNIDKASQATKARNRNSSYYMPTDLVTPEEWSGFDNVYQVHNPHIVMDNAIRDVSGLHVRPLAWLISTDLDAILLLLSLSKRI